MSLVLTPWCSVQKAAEAQQRKIWEEQKKSKHYEGLFSEEAFEERKRLDEEQEDDDFFM